MLATKISFYFAKTWLKKFHKTLSLTIFDNTWKFRCKKPKYIILSVFNFWCWIDSLSQTKIPRKKKASEINQSVFWSTREKKSSSAVTKKTAERWVKRFDSSPTLASIPFLTAENQLCRACDACSKEPTVMKTKKFDVRQYWSALSKFGFNERY